ncbi:YqhG family protein, partial [Staphylococcus sp. SIMBA_130]
MHQENIHNYLRSYFLANDCRILNEKPGLLDVQLTIELDKELMNRPFYWHYLEKTGGTPR